jgi:hypothetical protein
MTSAKTIGMVEVAFFAARVATPPSVYDDVNIEPDELGGELRQPLHPSLRPSGLDDDVAAVDIAEFGEPLPESLEARVATCCAAG